ncbi:MAG: hypothetical protein FWG65_02780 [Turicibacter sp.]|nr:hypothetical protein [Turicibacter sp.]
MQEPTNPTAQNSADKAQKADFDFPYYSQWQIERGFEKFAKYYEESERRAVQKAVQDATQKTVEEMLIVALKHNAPQSVIDVICESQGITAARLAELQKQI